MSKIKQGRKSRPSDTPAPAGKAAAGSRSRGPKAGSGRSPDRRHVSSAAVRETIESVVIAFVLAFLFRTFEAEAFVIPTGSMAPTLMGRHKDVTCPKCGHSFRISASSEVNQATGRSEGAGHQIVAGTCPICRHTMDLRDPETGQVAEPSYHGDRILVGKFAYQFADPARWDVAVFKYPGDANTNFIKRLVGLPGERLRISRGDVFVAPLKPDGAASDGAASGGAEPEWTIARKPPKKLLGMLQLVFDNERIAAMLDHGWGQPRWWQDGGPDDAWKPEDNHRSFVTKGPDVEVWVRYRHLVPNHEQWLDHMTSGSQSYDRLYPHLISDFCAYNTGISKGGGVPDPDVFGLHWVGDLALECRVEVASDAGELVFELVEGGRQMQCRVDVATGRARLSIDGRGLVNRGGDPVVPEADTEIAGPGTYDVRFSNCDDELLFWVDGDVVEFDAPTTYDPLGNGRPTMADLAPVGVASRGAAVKLERLRIYRDLYYIAARAEDPAINGIITDFGDRRLLHTILYDPRLWEHGFDDMAEVAFTLEPDRFLALGDNSAKSKDSRLWPREGFEYFVKRELLIGKAIFIYWPHSWHRIPGTGIPMPFFPNFPRMGFVR